MFQTPRANRLHIGIFGKRNSGKSSLINALTGQALSIVSATAGTTTDPVFKSIELLPLGPCVLIDTAGLDDNGPLGQARIKQTLKVLRKTDLALMVMASRPTAAEKKLVEQLKNRNIPFIFVLNKTDRLDLGQLETELGRDGQLVQKVSCLNAAGIKDLKEKIQKAAPQEFGSQPLIRDIIRPSDHIVMVCPIDRGMPQGRLILPQVQVLREILDAKACAHVCQDTELGQTLKQLKRTPALVISDSQVFGKVKRIVPRRVPLTSFSVIYARHKGDLKQFKAGTKAVSRLKDNDKILIAECCTHHPQPEDIGRTKIPKWLAARTGKELSFDVVSGGDFSRDLKSYKLVVSCGGCMINIKEMHFRLARAREQNIPITNYGLLIAYLNDMLDRVLEPFAERRKTRLKN